MRCTNDLLVPHRTAQTTCLCRTALHKRPACAAPHCINDLLVPHRTAQTTCLCRTALPVAGIQHACCNVRSDTLVKTRTELQNSHTSVRKHEYVRVNMNWTCCVNTTQYTDICQSQPGPRYCGHGTDTNCTRTEPLLRLLLILLLLLLLHGAEPFLTS